MAATEIWILWTELQDDVPAGAEFFTSEDDAKQHGIELAFSPGSTFEWGPPRENRGLPKYNRDDVEVHDPSLWPGFQVLWETDASGRRSGYFKLEPATLNQALTDCSLRDDHGFSLDEEEQVRPE